MTIQWNDCQHDETIVSAYRNTKATDDPPPQDLDWNHPATRMALGLEFVEKYLNPSEVVALRLVCQAFDRALCSAGFYWIDRIRPIEFLSFTFSYPDHSRSTYLSLLRGFGHGNRLPIHCDDYPTDVLIENYPDIFALITHLVLNERIGFDSIRLHSPLPHTLIRLEIKGHMSIHPTIDLGQLPNLETLKIFDRDIPLDPLRLRRLFATDANSALILPRCLKNFTFINLCPTDCPEDLYAFLELDTLESVTLKGKMILNRPIHTKCKGPALSLSLDSGVVGDIIISEGVKRLSLDFGADPDFIQARIYAPYLDMLIIDIDRLPPHNLSMLTGCLLSAQVVWLKRYSPIIGYDLGLHIRYYLEQLPLEVRHVRIQDGCADEVEITRNDYGGWCDGDEDAEWLNQESDEGSWSDEDDGWDVYDDRWSGELLEL